MKKALIVWGGWDGHEPKPVSDILADALTKEGFAVEVADTLDAFLDADKLKSLDLIVPEWTMGNITAEQVNPLLEAVRSGVGIAGVHGGMCDAFRNDTEYQFMCGGQWVAHPGGSVTYTVNIIDQNDPITAGIDDFEVTSEQYYMHIDPAIRVLATTTFDNPVGRGDVVMPVTWQTNYEKGRVFYCSLGHSADVMAMPQVLKMVTRGMVWAAK
jgi:type 1 glutamine amidotransferase